MKHNHLSPNERYQIQAWLAQDLSKCQIARRLGRHRSTIYRELARCEGAYDAQHAQRHRADCALRCAANDSLVLVAGRNFINNAGAAPLNPGAGRFLVYSSDPAANSLGAFTPANTLLGHRYAANPPSDGSMTGLAGNYMVYSKAAVVSVVPTPPAKPGANGLGSPALNSAYASALTAIAESANTFSRRMNSAVQDDAGALAAAAAEAENSDAL
ncbi:helix-turn-helix domain-containing protein [Polaromonas sp. SM01]|uniref:helix-turn-helix domain-containing protein n=1 Tax=Polaromonas sp. SM01 TaxID=3085630 RepID=UPI0029822EB3|nr:helix-turn-helix domain-containing protein [Polaromonas sp. SM01]MDW5444803.1 helix-turn-helix domain-containing protein [Polaromonas sp. SM01]